MDIGLDRAIDLQHGCLHSGDDLRVLKGNASAFIGIGFQVVEFGPNQLGGLNQLESAGPRKKVMSRRMSASGGLDCSADVPSALRVPNTESTPTRRRCCISRL
jgi:hypothetical protein